MEQIKIISEITGVRIDSFIADQMNDLSRSRIGNLIEEGLITVNGKTVSKSYKIKLNDQVLIQIPPPENGIPEPVEMPLDIIFEDQHLIVLNKPKGVVVHPAPGHYDDTLVNGLLSHCGEDLSGINGEIRPGIVHRIDKDTSGLLVIAKSDQAHRGLSAQFETHSIDRIYEAIVFGNVPESGHVDTSIGRSMKDRKKMAIDQQRGRKAITHYELIKQYGQWAHVACKLETGRTHQIRVHMSSIGHFVLGDMVYGRPVSNLKLDFEGQCLHARVLGFDHPITGEHLYFESPLPDYFINILTKLEHML